MVICLLQHSWVSSHSAMVPCSTVTASPEMLILPSFSCSFSSPPRLELWWATQEKYNYCQCRQSSNGDRWHIKGSITQHFSLPKFLGPVATEHSVGRACNNTRLNLNCFGIKSWLYQICTQNVLSLSVALLLQNNIWAREELLPVTGSSGMPFHGAKYLE